MRRGEDRPRLANQLRSAAAGFEATPGEPVRNWTVMDRTRLLGASGEERDNSADAIVRNDEVIGSIASSTTTYV